MPDWSLEHAAPGHVAGVDEAGRGPAAGPVVAAAVILDPANTPEGLDDSKALSKRRRALCARALWNAADTGACAISVGVAEPSEIDQINILHATMCAMARAVAGLSRPPDHVLVDGNRLPVLPCTSQAVVKGDSRSVSIAAASIIAKVTRDALMEEADRRWPIYGFAEHAGYLTADHRGALARFGPCPIHRRSFAPVRAALEMRQNQKGLAR